jgi:FkbM family methyltransferase
MKMVNGWAYPDADEFMVKEQKDDGTYQASHLQAALAHVTDFSAALDGGAHVGTWSRLMSQSFERVIACEPSADTFEALTANMAAFGCANVELHQCALGATAGTVTMAPLDPRAEALKNTGARFVREGGEIPRITIDALGLPSLGFLKLDIEGSEPLALQGARETLRRCRPIVLFENKGFWRHRYGFPIDGPQQILSACGYRQVEIAGKDLIWAAA